MAEIRLSRTGDGGDAGYTLVELLVVIAVMGLLLLALPALISAARPGVEAKSAAEALANDLRAARAAAVSDDREADVVFDPAHNDYRMPPDGAVHKLPSAVLLEVLAADGAAVGKETPLRFFPDGSSTGARLKIISGTHIHWVVAHGITGRISLDE